MAARSRKAAGKARKTAKRRPKARTADEVLIELGRQVLAQEVKGVLEDSGIDSSIKVDITLTAPSGKRPAKKASKANRRR